MPSHALTQAGDTDFTNHRPDYNTPARCAQFHTIVKIRNTKVIERVFDPCAGLAFLQCRALQIVGRFLGESPPQQFAIVHIGCRHTNRGTEPLMRIDNYRVGQFQSGKQVANAFIQNARQAIGAIDMEPDTVLLGDGANFGQWVDRAGIGGAGIGDDGHRQNIVG